MKLPEATFTIAAIELSRPLTPIATRGKEHLLALVSLNRRPLGWVQLRSSDRSIGTESIATALWEQLEWPLIRHALAPEEAAAPVHPPISVVVCTRNRPELLERCLTSLLAIDYPHYEIIVVDNAPDSDATRKVVERSGVRYVREDRPGLDWARNLGWMSASHEIIAYSDDDATVSPGWLKGIAKGFEHPSIMAVTGLVAPLELETPAQVLFERVYGGMGKGFAGRLFHRDQLRPSQLIAIHAVGVGANMAFRRTVFQQLGGFDTALDVGTPSSGGGDLDMFHRVVAAGLPLWYEPRALVWHQHRRELGALERQLYNDGRSFGVYLQKLWKTRTVPRTSLLRFATWQWGRWLVGRVVLGLLGRHRMPLPLLWAGLRGALGSPRAYRATYRSDRRLRNLPEPAPADSEKHDRWGVSVIIPAFNAGGTLAECLDSVRRQSCDHWEILIVDDGSTDATLSLARGYAGKDPRITVLEQAHQGVSAARNLGLARARYPWVLFLDADDWVEPAHLERMTSALGADPSLDAVHCGWTIATAAGKVVEEDQCKATGDLFHLLARHPAFIVHACVIRRDLVRSVGGFEPAYTRIQDWVMWQRVARAGCRFGRVAESLAGYRMQPASVSSEPEEVLDQALRAIALGHGPDPAVPNAAPRHAAGRPVEELPEAKLAFLGWPAGIRLARGEDARPLLDRLEPYHWPGLATHLGGILYSAAPRALGRPRSTWSEIWSQVSQNVTRFLDAVEAHTSSPGLSRAVQHDLARCILGDSTEPFPLTVGLIHGVRVELTEPLSDIEPGPGIERLWCLVEIEGKRIGHLELPVCGPVVPAAVLRDALADRFAWTVLGRFFTRQVYHDPAADHDAIGWDALLSEAWDQTVSDETATRAGTEWIQLEVSSPLPRLTPEDAAAPVEIHIGGTSAGVFRLTAEQLSSPETIRGAINDLLGYEFCRVVVREALIGRPLVGPSLRERLHLGTTRGEWDRVIGASPTVSVFWRHPDLPVGGSGSRRALLPVAAIAELEGAARASGQRTAGSSPAGATAAYVPELISGPIPGLADIGESVRAARDGRRYDRHHFEVSFARTSDPWSYRSDYERIKYEQTMELVPEGPIERALELGCAEGHFTVRLAPRVGKLIAADIADLALVRAEARCREHHNIDYRRLDLVTDPLPGENDLVVCSEVLYYAGNEAALAGVATRIAESIRPGGHFLTAHANVVADEPTSGFVWDVPYGAATISRVFGEVPALRLVREIKTPLYRIQLYQKPAQASAPVPRPDVRVELNRAQPDPSIARWIRWEKGARQQPERLAAAITSRLPILMYHQVAESGAPARRRWRVTPQRFEEQLRYLRESGFYSVGLSTWRSAMGQRRGLPGRAVMITFDDGYLDFASHAWPLLRQYGYSAVLFIVSGRVGASNDWDPLPAAGDRLMDWDQLRRLCREGLEIGSHSATHPRLRNLAVEDVTREAAISRATIQRELRQPVTTFAYPFGDHDPAIRHLVGACGYDQGFGCYPSDRAPLTGDLMNQPRIEVLGDHDMTQFIADLEDR